MRKVSQVAGTDLISGILEEVHSYNAKEGASWTYRAVASARSPSLRFPYPSPKNVQLAAK